MTIDTNNPSSLGTSPTQGTSADLQDRAKQDFGQVTEKAKEEFDAVAHRAAEDVKDLQHKAKEQVDAATEKAKSFADDQKTLAAGQINGVASAITKVADQLDGSDQATVARYARDLASGLSGLGKTVEDRNVDDLIGLAQDFGRKQPLAFLGAAALAGFVASRFALASAHRRDSAPTSTATGATGSNNYGAGASGSYASSGSTYQPGGSTYTGTGQSGGSTYSGTGQRDRDLNNGDV